MDSYLDKIIQQKMENIEAGENIYEMGRVQRVQT